MHLKLHFKKKFICNVCKKSFIAKYLLDQYMRSHTKKDLMPVKNVQDHLDI